MLFQLVEIICCGNIVLYQRFGCCSHCLVVAIKENVVVEYPKHLQRTPVTSLTQTESKNVDSKKVGRKVAVKPRKRNIFISSEKSYSTAEDCQFYQQATCYQVQAPYDRPQDYQI